MRTRGSKNGLSLAQKVRPEESLRYKTQKRETLF